MLSFKPGFHSSFSPLSRGSLVPLHILPLKFCHLHIWGCWYLSWQSWFQLVVIQHSISHDVLCIDGITLMLESEEELKSFLLKVKEEGEKVGLKLTIQKAKIIASTHHFMANRWEISGNSDRLYFLGLQSHCRWWLQPWNWKTFAPWKENYDTVKHHIKK